MPGAWRGPIVHDTPVAQREWLPHAARLLGAPTPARLDVAAARQKFNDLRVCSMNEQRGASNAKARRELGWRPAFPSWKDDGFEALHG